MPKISDNESEEDFHDASDKPRDNKVEEKHSSFENDKDTDLSDVPDDEFSEVDDGTVKNEDPKLDEELSKEDLELLQKDLTEEQLLENKEKAEKLKIEGNELFKSGKSVDAIGIYTEALNLMPLSNTKERAILFANRAAAKLQIDSKKPALEDCNKALQLWPGYMRCLIRRAKLHEGLENYDEAIEDFKRICELDPSNRDAQEALVRLPPLAAEKKEKMKEEVLGKLKDLGNMFLRPFGLSTDNFQMTKDPNSGGFSINMKN